MTTKQEPYINSHCWAESVSTWCNYHVLILVMKVYKEKILKELFWQFLSTITELYLIYEVIKPYLI